MTMLDLFTGGALSNFSVFSLGIMPYITASIIMQLMQGVIPAVGRWAREGDTGRRKITQVTRYLTLGLGLINAVGYLLLFKSPAYGVQFSTEVPEALTEHHHRVHAWSPVPPSSCGWASSSPSAASATACRSSSS